MKNTDKRKFADLMRQVYEIKGKEATPSANRMWYAILEPYEIEDIRVALGQVMRTSAYLPSPSDVVDILDPSQWPTPAEAWSTYPADERDTGAVCDETLAAWASAKDLYESGDVIGARRAYEGSYGRHMEAAKAAGKRRPAWRLSLGYDAARRESGALSAIKRGLLPASACVGVIGEETRKAISRDTRDRAGDVRPVSGFLGWADGSGTA